MAEDYDGRLLESAKVRKHKLDDALLFGINVQERSYSSSTMKLMYSLLLAALIAAICVGFSFVQHLLSERNNPAATALLTLWTDLHRV